MAKKKKRTKKKAKPEKVEVIRLPVYMPGNLKKEWENLRRDRDCWMETNQSTLGAMVTMLDQCLEQCLELETSTGDGLVVDHEAETPEPLASELACWDNSEDDCTFSYRRDNIEEERDRVKTIIEEIGSCVGWPKKDNFRPFK